MAIVSGPQNRGIPGYTLAPKPKLPALPHPPGVGPQNINLPTYRPGDVNNPNGQLAPGPGAPAPLQAPAAPAPVAAPPPPVDFGALALSDPRYTTGLADLQRQNDLTNTNLLNSFRGRAQSFQDNANAHNMLFSGAAVNAQRSAAQGYADQAAQQAQNLQSGQHQLYQNVWQSLIQQLAGGGA